MAQYPLRPAFAEGQVLAAADLALLGDLPRAAAQRHNRFVHRSGIVTGLTLTTVEDKDAGGNAFKQVWLEPGMAIDGEGCELLVTQRRQLDPAELRQTIGNSIAEDQNYPVFITAQAQPVSGAGSSALAASCGSSAAPPQIEEAVRIAFMTPGEELSEQTASALSAEPAPDSGGSPWLIFVGYVSWSSAAEAFADSDSAAAARFRQVAGINAGTVAGNGTRVLLHPAGNPAAGDAALELSQTADGPALVFGTYQSALTPLDELFSVNAKGDLKLKGAVTSKTMGGTVALQSGIASDGMILPLPAGVTAAQVSSGAAQLHIQVSPLIDPAASPDPSSDFGAIVQECRVDENRQVHCRLCWLTLPTSSGGGALGAVAVSQPGQVSYLICASVNGE